ncbi:MAG: site-specific integrase, partial [Cyanobacteria bacterium J06597_1]
MVAQQLAAKLSFAVYMGDVDEVLAKLKALRDGHGEHTQESKESIVKALTRRMEDKVSARAESSLRRLLGKYPRNIGTQYEAEVFVKWLAKGKRSASSVNRYLDVLKPVAPHLFGAIPKLKKEEQKPRQKPFTTDEVKRILAVLKDDRYYSHYYPYVVFLFRTGVRTSEAIGLRWTDVDLANGTVYIGSSLARKGETQKRVRKSTKTGKARVVPLDKETLTLLASLPHTHSLVFPSPKGYPIDDRGFSRNCWPKVLAKAG